MKAIKLHLGLDVHESYVGATLNPPGRLSGRTPSPIDKKPAVGKPERRSNVSRAHYSPDAEVFTQPRAVLGRVLILSSVSVG